MRELVLDDGRVRMRASLKETPCHRGSSRAVPFRACCRYLASSAPMVALCSKLPSSRGAGFSGPAEEGERECRRGSVRLCWSSATSGLPSCEPAGCWPRELTDSAARSTQMQIPPYIAGERKARQALGTTSRSTLSLTPSPVFFGGAGF